MHPIPIPELLDADRIKADEREDFTVDDHRTGAQAFGKALHDGCEYATELWQHHDAARRYLLGSLPSDPRAPAPAADPVKQPQRPNALRSVALGALAVLALRGLRRRAPA